MPIHLHMVKGCLCSTSKELSRPYELQNQKYLLKLYGPQLIGWKLQSTGHEIQDRADLALFPTPALLQGGPSSPLAQGCSAFFSLLLPMEAFFFLHF